MKKYFIMIANENNFFPIYILELFLQIVKYKRTGFRISFVYSDILKLYLNSVIIKFLRLRHEKQVKISINNFSLFVSSLLSLKIFNTTQIFYVN